jgi:broad specificity phosphatase PhoE
MASGNRGHFRRGNMDFVANPWQAPIGYVVRHGETEANASNCFRGWENWPLNEEGQRACEAIANFFSYEQIGLVVSSDLDRAMETAQAVQNSGSVACPYLSPDFNLRPWNIAGFAGQEKTEKNQRRLQRYIDNPDERIPDGESLNEFRGRDMVSQYLGSPYNGLPTVIVTHTSNLTHLASQVDESEEGMPEAHDIVEPGGIVAVYMDEQGKLKLVPRMGAITVEAEPQAS